MKHDNKLAVTGCVAVTKVGAKCPLFSTFHFSEKCYNQSAVDKNGQHGKEITCCAGLMSIYSKFIGKNTLFWALNTTKMFQSQGSISCSIHKGPVRFKY